MDKGCPLVIGGPLPHVMNAKLIALKEAETAEFQDYAKRVQANAWSLAGYLSACGAKIVTGGTDNHLLLMDVTQYGLNGRMAESLLREAGITLNRNALPFDKNGPWYTSGLRLGTAAVTTLGMDIDNPGGGPEHRYLVTKAVRQRSLYLIDAAQLRLVSAVQPGNGAVLDLSVTFIDFMSSAVCVFSARCMSAVCVTSVARAAFSNAS